MKKGQVAIFWIGLAISKAPPRETKAAKRAHRRALFSREWFTGAAYELRISSPPQ